MQTVITGCGRSGTNLLLEIVRAAENSTFTKTVEDRGFFNHKKLPLDYGSKIAVEWDAMTIDSMMHVMEVNKKLKVLFSFRHPYDVILSKVYRGRPRSQGGDNDSEETAKDGTVEVAAEYVNKSWAIYHALATKHPNRVKPVRMEDILMNTRNTVSFIAKSLAIAVNPNMHEPWKHNRNAYQNRRYNHAMDRREINKWKDLNKSYDGYFKDIWDDHLLSINYLVEEQANYFGYGLI